MELWDKVSKTNPKYTKKVKFGREFTAIDPHSQVMCATEAFGPAGTKWGWAVAQIEHLESIKEIAILIRLWHGKKEDYVEQWGQAGLFIDKANSKKDSDCMKKATTDGITKCLSYLGFNADVFLGKFDDNKYVAEQTKENDPAAKEFSEWSKTSIVDLESMSKEEELTSWLKINQGKVEIALKSSNTKASAMAVMATYTKSKNEISITNDEVPF